MKDNFIKTTGRILFDPPNVTSKHDLQDEWKVVAMVILDGDICDLYSYFIRRRYHLTLTAGSNHLRGPHVTFINDRVHDKTSFEFQEKWNNIKNKYDGKEIDIYLDVDARSDSKHWWLNIPEIYRNELQSIRDELGLGRPYAGMHMSIGKANEKNINHSQYIHNLLVNKMIE